MLSHGFVHGKEEVEPEERVFVAPFADGLAAFGGDEAAAGSADCYIKICVVGNQEADEGEEGLVEGKGPESE